MRPAATDTAVPKPSMRPTRYRTNVPLLMHPPPPPAQDDGSGGGSRELHFSRVIVPSSSDPSLPPSALTYASEYRLDGRLVGWAAYAARLGQLGILVKVRNFLVFQVGYR